MVHLRSVLFPILIRLTLPVEGLESGTLSSTSSIQRN